MIASLEKKPLGELLLSRGAVQQEQVQSALEEQRKCNHQKLLGEILVEQGLCSEDQITAALAQAYGVPYARVSPKVADAKIISVLPKEFLEKHQVLPLFLVEGLLTVAVPEPANVFLLEEIERISGRAVQVVAATARDIKATLQAYLPNDQVFVIDDIVEEREPGEFTVVQPRSEPPTDLAKAAEEPPVVKLVNYCIFNAVKQRASDVHIEPGENALRIRYRIDGRLTERLRPPPQMHLAVTARLKMMAGMEVAQRRLPQDGSIHLVIENRPVELHVGTVPGHCGEKIVIRISDNEKVSLRLEKLGFTYDALKAWRKLIAMQSGIVLVSGPAGCGKSTTLYAALQELNREDLNICTVEDPVEHHLSGANQFQVNAKIGFTLPLALRTLLRQDPDVLMVSELADGETAMLAAQAALTGHLVLSTMHTPDAVAAIGRLYNIGLEPYLVGATLGGVLAQRLVRKLCQSCKEAYKPSASEKRQMEKSAGVAETLYRAKGCEQCGNIGYSGRIGIYELLIPQEEMVEKISQGATAAELREAAKKAGMKTLRTDGMEKVKAGITSMDEVYRVAA